LLFAQSIQHTAAQTAFAFERIGDVEDRIGFAPAIAIGIAGERFAALRTRQMFSHQFCPPMQSSHQPTQYSYHIKDCEGGAQPGL
jgi:hypothetical protein